jgi:hypothetical protein
VWLGVSSNKSILLGEDTANTNGDLVVNDGLVVFADNVDVDSPHNNEEHRINEQANGCTTMLSELSLYGSLSRPSGLSHSRLMMVPFKLLTSLMSNDKRKGQET